jgi:two-component system chemotaxis sensor kinase CheA
MQQKAVNEGQKAPLLGDVLIENQSVQKEVVDVALEKQAKNRDRKKSGRALRVDADKLDMLINLVGELVISGATTSLLAQRLADEQLLESVSQMGRLVEEIRDNALTLRMVQIGETFSRFQRVVRDVSKELGKDIRLEISGAESELDKTVVEKIGDPLMHLVRNAMDHGIESAEERRAAGKPEYGTLSLNAFHDSGSIVIEVSDDGKGLSKEKILAKAMEKGLIESGQNLTDKEIYRLIFEAGFSTAEQVTNLSGRGVGMDVVRRNIESLRGSVDVDSNPGKGSTVSIRLPLTLAIIDGFLVGVGDSSYVVPLDMVIECIELEDEERKQVSEGFINLRGEVLPFLRLRDLFDEEDSKATRESIVVVQYGTQRAGFVVDELLGEFQTVIKPMGKILQGVKGVSGTTILGSGDVAVILDVHSLVQRATQLHGQTSLTTGNDGNIHTQQTLH